MIEIDFMGGLHGNFLCYAINSLDPSIRKHNPFTELGTSHIKYPKTIAKCGHYSLHPDKFKRKTNDVISITAELDDCLLVNLLCYGRAGDYNFDLKNFNINFYNQLKKTYFVDTIDHISQIYQIDIKSTNTISRGILREYFKFNFSNYSKNNIICAILKQKYNFDVLEINFRELYNFDSFLSLLKKIIIYFDLKYEIDPDWYNALWHKFIEKIDAIEQNNQAYNILNAIQKKENAEIDFNLLQESWLNARLESIYNKEMPLNQEVYFQTTSEIIKYLNEI